MLSPSGRNAAVRARSAWTGGAVLAALLLAAVPAAAQPGDEAALRDVVARYADARNRGDKAALEALFTPDADQLVSSGEWRRGRVAVVAGSLASSQNRAGQRTFTVETVRMLAPTVAVVDSRYEIGVGGGEAARQMWASWLLVKTAGGWRIAAIRNMRPVG
jgi:uncharacterized protein (TIGR02246 family)